MKFDNLYLNEWAKISEQMQQKHNSQHKVPALSFAETFLDQFACDRPRSDSYKTSSLELVLKHFSPSTPDFMQMHLNEIHNK